MKQKDSTVGMASGLAVGMAFGLILGAVAGVLLAPASGAETRRRLRFERDNVVDAARQRAEQTMARLRRARPEEEGGEEEVEEEGGAFSGA